MNRIFPMALVASSLLLAGCYGADFTPTSGGTDYTPTPRAPESIEISSDHPGPEYAEVGLLTGSGGSFEGAIKRIKEEAAERGCDLVAIMGEAIQSGYGTPGAAYGMTKSHVRAACYVKKPDYVAEAPRPSRRTSAQASVGACAPSCRLGFDCVNGSCVSACNPPCGDGEQCTGHGDRASCTATPENTNSSH